MTAVETLPIQLQRVGNVYQATVERFAGIKVFGIGETPQAAIIAMLPHLFGDKATTKGNDK